MYFSIRILAMLLIAVILGGADGCPAQVEPVTPPVKTREVEEILAESKPTETTETTPMESTDLPSSSTPIAVCEDASTYWIPIVVATSCVALVASMVALYATCQNKAQVVAGAIATQATDPDTVASQIANMVAQLEKIKESQRGLIRLFMSILDAEDTEPSTRAGSPASPSPVGSCPLLKAGVASPTS